MAEPLLDVRTLTKRFDGLTVIDNVSISVVEGEKAALLGPNGAGKTMLFNLISGIYPVSEGRVRLAGADITDLPSSQRVRHGLARTFQNVRLMGHLTALENVLVGQHHLSRPVRGLVDPVLMGARNRWKSTALEALRAAGLERYAGVAVRNLPYGIRKQVELARAMQAKPRLLLLDEPAAGLNPVEARALKDQLEAIAASGVTLLVIEHNMRFVGDLCRRVVVLNFGRKIADGTPEQIRNMAEVREAYLGTDAAHG